MSNRTQQYPGPDGLDAVPLGELVSALEGHLGDLERDRAATGEARPPARTRAAAVHALTIITVLLGRLADLASPVTRTALEHGATPADIAAALGQNQPDPGPEPAADGDVVTISRDTSGYYLAGRYGAARIATRRPLTADDVRTHVRGYPRALVVVDLPAGDPLLGLARPAADAGREPAPRDAADMHPRDHHRDHLRVVGPDHAEPAPADDPGVVLDMNQAKDARATLEHHAAAFLADEPFAVRRDFGEALVVVIRPGVRLTAEQVADQLYRCGGIELQPDDVAAALQRAAASRP